jgi:hypothetical protein
MTVFIACPTCGHKKDVPGSFAGRRVKCPKCGKTFAVPRHHAVRSGLENALAPPIPPSVNHSDRRQQNGSKVGSERQVVTPVLWYKTDAGIALMGIGLALFIVGALVGAIFINRHIREAGATALELAELRAQEESRLEEERAEEEKREQEKVRLAKWEKEKPDREAIPALASELIDDYYSDVKWADNIYLGKFVKVQGVCTGAWPDQVVVNRDTGTHLSMVRGWLRSEQDAKRAAAVKGGSCFIIGKCAGIKKTGLLSTEVQLDNCIVSDLAFSTEQAKQVESRAAARQEMVEARRREEKRVADEKERKWREETEKYGSASDACRFAEEYVKALLRYPDKASFSWSNVDNVAGTDGRWKCSGKFTGINGFGVRENMRYVALVQFNKSTYYEISTFVFNEAGQIVASRGDGRWKTFP